MGFVRYIISLIAALLFSTMGTSIAIALPQTATDLVFTQAQTAHFSQAEHIGFTARAPPTTVLNVAVTGEVTVKHGGAFVTHGAETQRASLIFGADLVATNSLPNPPSLTISNSQWGTKSAQHMRDFDLDVSNPAHRQQFRDMVENIGSNPDRVVTGTFSGGGPTGRRDVLFYVQGNDVVVTSPAGEFVTVLQNGVTNPNVVRALGQ